MSFPQQLASVLDKDDRPAPIGMVVTDEPVYAREGACAGAKFHSPQPLVLHTVPMYPGHASPGVMLCGTCADNLSVLQRLMADYDGDVPWPIRREFGNWIRALAEKGWEAVHGA